MTEGVNLRFDRIFEFGVDIIKSNKWKFIEMPVSFFLVRAIVQNSLLEMNKSFCDIYAPTHHPIRLRKSFALSERFLVNKFFDDGFSTLYTTYILNQNTLEIDSTAEFM